MSRTQWLVLWLFFVAYWFLAATVFYLIEHPLERERRIVERQYRNDIHDLLQGQYNGRLQDLLDKLTEYCDKPFTKIDNKTYDDENDEEHPYKWSFYNSVFFALITASTVGYGNVSPSSPYGQLLVIFYSLFGIPFFGIVISQVGEFFSSIFIQAHNKYKAQVYETKSALALQIVKYLIPGVIVFIAAPAILIWYMEGWPMITAIYYSYVTLTTIGYGDFVAGHLGDLSVGYAVYKAALLFWIMFGLGYLIMILGFISRAMKSKRVIRLERRLAGRIKQTQSRIWREFVSDVSHLRRALNELYLMKVKPVYKDGPLSRSEGLSQSCPDLRAMEEEAVPQEVPPPLGPRKRARAYSESVTRVMSEGHLDTIDMKATFATIQPSSFLANMVDALETQNVQEGSAPGGINMFSDEEILASEVGGWSMGGEAIRGHRRRALSEISPNHKPPPDAYHYLHHWNHINNNKSNGFLKPEIEEEPIPPRVSGLRRLSNAAFNLLRRGNSRPSEDEEMPPEKRWQHRLSLQETDPSRIMHDLNYLTYTPNTEDRRPSLFDALHASNRGHSISPILEQTSLADFIRVMATLKNQNPSEIEDGLPPGPMAGGPLPRQLSRLHGEVSSTKSLATRRASLSPVEILNRRRFSHVPNVSTSTLSSDDVFLPRRRASSVTPRPRISPRSSMRVPSFVLTTPQGDKGTLVEEEAKGSDESLDHIVIRL